MADISKITLPNDTTYNIKDKNARNFTNTPYYEQDEEALMFQLGESYMTGEQDNQPYSFRAAGGSADIGNREYDKIVGGTVAWNQLVRNEASTNETDFADIVTVDDAVEDAAAVKVAIEPVQNLHGYDHPWPAGGSANKWDEEWEIGAISTTTGQNSAGLSQIRAKNHIPVVEGNTYCVVTRTGRTNGIWTLFYDEEKNVISEGLPYGGQASSNARRFDNGEFLTIPANCAYIRFYFQTYYGTEYMHDTAINYPSTETSYVPYSNICPITGWDGVKVTRVAENLLGGDALKSDLLTNISRSSESDGNVIIPTSVIGYLGFDKFEEGERYTFILDLLPTGTYLGFRIEFDDDTTQTVFTGLTKNERQTVVAQSTAGKTIKAVRVAAGASAFTVYPETSGIFKGVLSAEDFEPYRGNVYPVDWTDEAGTVYGGELTVNEDGTGTLMVDRKRIVVDQNSSFLGTGDAGYESSTGTNRYITDIDIQGTYYVQYYRCVSNILKRKYSAIWSTVSSALWGFTFNGHQLHMVFENAVVGITDEMTSSQRTQAIKTWLANNNIEIIAPLAAPITYTLTTSQIRTLLGTNNVWADAGQVSLSYTGTDEHLVLKSNRKYFTRISGTDSVLLGSGQEITVAKGTNNIFDLTQMFGTTIANYVYSLETATSGAGVAWFRKLFPKPYYEYNPGELMSVQAVAHKLVGFNAWDEEWELGIINTNTGEETDSNSNIRSKNYIRVIPGATYYFKLGTTDISNNIVFYDAEKNYVAASGEHVNDVFTVPEDAHYMKFYMSTNYGRTYLSNICINLSGNGERDGEYEEYKMHSYPLDSSLTLRGIPKLDANNQLYYDGDVYESDGTVTRKYGIVDLGTLTYTKTSSGLFSTLSLASNIKRSISSNYATGWLLSSMYEEMASIPITGPNGTNPSPNLRMAENTKGGIYFNNTSYTDAGTFKTAMNGVYLLYEFATPMTETAEPYDNPQIVSSEGTEEYITTNIVFVGHETKY